MGSNLVFQPDPDCECPCESPAYPLAQDESWQRSKTPGNKDLRDIRLARAEYPERCWAPEFKALLTLGEFATTDWRKIDLSGLPPLSGIDTNAEIDALLALAEAERETLLREILVQHDGFGGYFLDMLTIRRETHPATFLVLMIASKVGELVMVYFKNRFRRPRPSQLCPALMPPLDVQGHPSYPSGHALQARLMAHCAAAATEDCCPELAEALFVLAYRIARNREVAGFHYRSDTEAGIHIADAVFAILRSVGPFQEAAREAQAEWR
jgi:hypothetical protein